MKVCHNSLVHEIQNAVNETLTLAGLNGIGVQDFVDAVSIGGGQNFYLESKTGAIKREDWTCAFPVEYAAKDLAIGGHLGQMCGLPMPGLQAALDTMQHAMDMGLGRLDNSASFPVFCRSRSPVRAAIRSAHDKDRKIRTKNTDFSGLCFLFHRKKRPMKQNAPLRMRNTV